MFKVGATFFIYGGCYAYFFFFSFIFVFLWFVLGTYPKQAPSYYPEKNYNGQKRYYDQPISHALFSTVAFSFLWPECGRGESWVKPL